MTVYPRCDHDCGACHRMVKGDDGVHRRDPDPDAYDCKRCQGCGERRADSIYAEAMQNQPWYDEQGDRVEPAWDQPYFCCDVAYNLARYGSKHPPGAP